MYRLLTEILKNLCHFILFDFWFSEVYHATSQTQNQKKSLRREMF